MDTGRLCMFCMEDNEGQSVCPHCGKDANAPMIKNHLKPGEILGGRFLVGRAVGQDASGVVYIVYDLRKERALRIREYLPRGVAMRAENSNELIPLPGMEGEFAAGLEETRKKAESADDPSKAMANFEENGTLYVVLRRKKAAAPVAAVPESDEAAAESAEGSEADEPEREEEADEDEEEIEEEDEDDGEKNKKRIITVSVALVIVLVLIAAVVIILTRSGSDNTVKPDVSNDPLNAWSAPTETPLPTAGATDEFGNIVAPTQGWQQQPGGDTINNNVATNTPIPDDYEPDWAKDTDTPAPTAVPLTPTPDPAATATPEPRVTIEPTLIDKKADKALINALQARLIELGWLDVEAPTGNYGNQTKDAVKAFQQEVHDHYDNTVGVDGIAGKATIGWLNRDDAPRKGGEQPTATPEPTATAEPDATATAVPDNTATAAPEDTATAEPEDTATPAPEDTATPEPAEPTVTIEPTRIDKNADSELITALQKRLMQLKWLDIDAPTGEYGKKTREAVRAFQRCVHDRYDGSIQVDGIAGEATIGWINRSDAPWNEDAEGMPKLPETLPTNTPVPTDTPAPTNTPVPTDTPAPTEEPTPSPTPFAPSAELTATVQARLIELGWLDASQNTGVYDNATALAVADFQRYMNSINGDKITLPEDGQADDLTVQWLTWSGAPTRAPLNTTPAPEESVTPEPTVIYSEQIDENSQEDAIIWLQTRLIELQWLKGTPNGVYDENTRTAVSLLQQYLNQKFNLTLDVSGTASTVTLSYLNNEFSEPVNPTPDNAPTLDFTADSTVNPTDAPVEAPTEQISTQEPTDAPVTDAPTEEQTEEPTEVPTEEPTEAPTEAPTEVPTEVPTEEPTEEPTTEPTKEPAVYDGSDEETVVSLKTRLIELGWMDASVEATGEYDQALKDAIEMLQTWLQTNWDEALWGDVSKMPSVNGEYVDWKTMNVIYSENPPVKPDDYVPMS